MERFTQDDSELNLPAGLSLPKMRKHQSYLEGPYTQKEVMPSHRNIF